MDDNTDTQMIPMFYKPFGTVLPSKNCNELEEYMNTTDYDTTDSDALTDDESFDSPTPVTCMSLIRQTVTGFGDLSSLSTPEQVLIGSLGAAGGWFSGVVIKKIGRVTATALGSGLFLIHAAHRSGYITINWNRMQSDADKARYFAKVAEEHVSKNHNNIQQLAIEAKKSNI